MILRHAPGAQRPGLSLMEVLVALSIFLLSFAVLSQLISLASERAHDVEMRTRAAQLCQSKMNEVSSGIVPLSTVSDTPFDEDGDWQWALDAEASSSVPNLWTVTVRVSRTNPDGPQANTELWGMLLDPTQRGSALDTVVVTSSTSTSSSSSDSSGSSTDTSGSSTTTPSTTTPAPSGGGTTPPKTTTPAPSGGSATPPKTTTPAPSGGNATPPKTTTPAPDGGRPAKGAGGR